VKKNETTPPAEPKWLTPAEVAEELRLAKSTVYFLVETKRLPGVKIGRTVRISREELDAFLKRDI
jgi:excisionase family DNA binding protein